MQNSRYNELLQQLENLLQEQEHIRQRLKFDEGKGPDIKADMERMEQLQRLVKVKLLEISNIADKPSPPVTDTVPVEKPLRSYPDPTLHIKPHVGFNQEKMDESFQQASKTTTRQSATYPRHLEPEVNEQSAFEMTVGIKWLSRLGIVALLIGIVMAITYTFPSFSNPLKILTGFIVAGLLYGTGHLLYPKVSTLGRILQGGGLSVGYISFFAMFFIPDVQLYDNPGVGLAVLFAYVAGTLGLAHRLNSQTVAVLSLAFGYYTGLYSSTPEVAFLSASILSLATVGITKLHPEWQFISIANLLGALATYCVWNEREGLYGNWVGQAYLILTFALFHMVSLLRARTGDIFLNQCNTFAFYGLYLSTQAPIGATGVLEGIVALLQVGSFVVLKALDKEEKNEPLAYGLLVTGLLFIGIGTIRYFDGQTIATILAAEALCLGFLSTRARHKPILEVASYVFLFSAYGALMPLWGATKIAIISSTAWLCLAGTLLETIPFRDHNQPARVVVQVVSQITMVLTTLIVAEPEWRSIAIIVIGFANLAIGFASRRKEYRIVGLFWILVIGIGSMLVDMAFLSMGYKIVLFLVLGVGLLIGSYCYSLLSKRLQDEPIEPTGAFNRA